MPYRKPRRTARRRPTRARRRVRRKRARPRLSGVVGLFGTPTIRRTMRYIDNLTLTSTVGAISTNVFSANGIYDPNISGTGHQPRWFDQIMPYFNHYCVIGSKITCTFSHTSNTTATTPITVGIAKRAISTTEPGMTNYTENGDCVWKSSPHNASNRTVSMSFSPRKYFGKKYTVDNYDLKGTIASNPSEQAFFHVFMDPVNSSESPSISAQVLIEYVVVFSEPNTVSAS